MSCLSLSARHPRTGGDPATLPFESEETVDDQHCAPSWGDPRLRGNGDLVFLARSA